MADVTVTWFNAEKGHGFITANDGGKDVVVRYSSINMGGDTVLEVGQLLQAPSTLVDGDDCVMAASAPRHCLALDTIEC